MPAPDLPITREFDDPAALRAHLDSGGDLAYAVLQGLDLRPFAEDLARVDVHCAVVLGGQAEPRTLDHLRTRGAILFPTSVFADCLFDPYPSGLYTPSKLILDTYRIGEPESASRTLDARIYHQYRNSGGAATSDFLISLARRLHDHGMADATAEFIEGKRVVAVMGGHGLSRATAMYATVASMAGELTRRGYLVATGGGPGAMEAAHLGALLAFRSPAALDAALTTLAGAPTFTDVQWQDTAARVHRDSHASAGDLGQSLGIPTWHYGHEPPTVFASHIAKYFDNSVREDGLLRIATAGVVFAPGSAGTLQEVFQDAAQNHYAEGPPSPMIFFGRRFWEIELPAYPLVSRLAGDREYSHLLWITDEPLEVIAWIDRWSPPPNPGFDTGG